MAKNPLLGNLLTGSLVKNVPLPAAVTDSTHAPLTLYFDNNSMACGLPLPGANEVLMRSPQALRSKDSVISELKQLICWTLTEPSRNVYFASLYLRVTNTIRSKVGTGYFDDDA